MAQGFPDFPAREDIKAAAIDAIKRDINQYSITWGSKNLRDAIAKKVKWFNGIDATFRDWAGYACRLLGMPPPTPDILV